MPAHRYTRWDDFAAGAETSEQHEPAAQRYRSWDDFAADAETGGQRELAARRYRSWDDFATDAETGEQRELELAVPEDEDTGAVATEDIAEEWGDDGGMDDWSMGSSASPNEDHQ